VGSGGGWASERCVHDVGDLSGVAMVNLGGWLV